MRAPLTETKAKNPDLFLNSGHLQESVAFMQHAKELGFSPSLDGTAKHLLRDERVRKAYLGV